MTSGYIGRARLCKTDIEEMCRTTLNKLSSKNHTMVFGCKYFEKPINIVNIPYIASNKEINEFESKFK